MSLWHIAIKNLRGRVRSYLLYFVSATAAVMVFEIFAMIYFNPQFDSMRAGLSKIAIVFQAASVAVLLFSAVFVLYSNSFFIRSRKKEIALYALLGMRRESIGRLLFCENMLIGMLATACGAALGTLLSRLFANLLLKMMAVVPSVAFSAEPRAILVTVAVFALLFSASSVLSCQAIYRFRLIELLGAEREGETRPRYCVGGALFAVALLSAGFAISAFMDVVSSGFAMLRNAALVLLMIIAGTTLLFQNLVPTACCALKRNKAFYYRPANLISTSQIVYRIRANSRILALVSLLCAAAFTLTSAAFSLYRGLEDVTKYYAPYSYLCKDAGDAQYEKILQTVKETGEVTLLRADRFTLLRGEGVCEGYSVYEEKNPGSPFPLYLLSASDYNRIIESTNPGRGAMSNLLTDFSGAVASGSCYFIDGNPSGEYSAALGGKRVSLNVGGATASLLIDGVSLHKYIGVIDLNGRVTLVVDDENYANVAKIVLPEDAVSFTGLLFDKPLDCARTVDALNAFIPARVSVPGVPNVSYQSLYRMNFSLYGSYVFIGLFIGVLFMLSLGSILYYKQLIEAQAEIGRYEVLKKIGMKYEEARASVIKQLGISFALPLALGSICTVFALRTYTRMMMELGQETPVFQNALFVCALLTLMYLGFYALSVKNYLLIVWKRDRRAARRP